jgi:long-chain acyl-CoA synthetase
MDYKFIPLLIKDRIATYGDRTALGYKDKAQNSWLTISWNEMGRRIDSISRALIYAGVGEQEMVGIFSNNMPEWTISDFALMNVRAVSIPIYSTDPVSSVSYIIHETEMKLIFVGEQDQYNKMLQIVQQSGRAMKIVVFDDRVDLKDYSNAIYFKQFYADEADADTDQIIQERLQRLTVEDITTILYTSGTTGESKGVVLLYRNFDSFLKIHDAYFQNAVDDEDVTLTFLPLSHIFERAWTLCALHKGVTVNYLSNPAGVVDALKVVRPTIMCTVPRFFEKIYSVIQAKVATSSWIKRRIFYWALRVGKRVMNFKRQEKHVPFHDRMLFKVADKLVLSQGREAFGGKMRYMPCSGAMLPDNINIFFHSAGVHIIYAYGMTETLATVTAYPWTNFKFGTVGKPLPFIDVKIGENSEILIKEDSLFKEYYKKPEETKQAFVDGWFKTGDAGEFDSEGNLIMKERIKDLIKTSGGKYVAPQLIESVISAEPFIEQVVVIGDERKYLTALIVPSFQALEEYAEKLKIEFKTREELINHSKIVQMMKEKLHKVQKDLATYQKVKKFKLLHNEFSIHTGEFTSTLKLKRKIIAQKFKAFIDEMYKD